MNKMRKAAFTAVLWLCVLQGGCGRMTEESGIVSENTYISVQEETSLSADHVLSEDMLAYWRVLNSKQPFISINEGNQEFYWNEYYWHLGSTADRHEAGRFMIVDLNDDGANEIVLECLPEATQVLHYEDGAVYSYQFVYRGMKRIHSNGVYEGSNGASSTYYQKLTELNKDGYTEEIIAFVDDGYYEVEGREATQEEFRDYVLSEIENVELAEDIEFTADTLDACLLGDLSKEELSMIKQASVDEMDEKEIEKPMGNEEMQAFRAVLLGEETFISMADDKREVYLDDDDFWDEEYGEYFKILYFSIVDMDGDGISEIILTCAYGDILVMRYEEGKVYSYQFNDFDEMSAIANDGVFTTGSINGNEYRRILSFEEDGVRTEKVGDHADINDDRIRYHFFSEEMIQQYFK